MVGPGGNFFGLEQNYLVSHYNTTNLSVPLNMEMARMRKAAAKTCCHMVEVLEVLEVLVLLETGP